MYIHNFIISDLRSVRLDYPGLVSSPGEDEEVVACLEWRNLMPPKPLPHSVQQVEKWLLSVHPRCLLAYSLLCSKSDTIRPSAFCFQKLLKYYVYWCLCSSCPFGFTILSFFPVIMEIEEINLYGQLLCSVEIHVAS